MKRLQHLLSTPRRSQILLATLALAIALPAAARTAVVTDGDVVPFDSATWDSSTTAYIGNTAPGTLTVDGGSSVDIQRGYVGSESSSEGTATVSGSDSTWEVSSYPLYVGRDGTGTLNIQDGGLVLVGSETLVNGRDDTGSSIVFDGGSLETASILAAAADLQGVGTIKTKGWVLDADVIVNTSTLVHSFAITDPATGKNISLQIDQTGTDLGTVGAGYRGTGTLTINSGGLVKSSGGTLGYHSGSEGTATVSGSDSTWEVGGISVGRYGTGTLNIQDGGLVKCSDGGYLAGLGSEGIATVSGSGSTWEMSDSLNVGLEGTGTLNIQDGGLVKCSDGYLGYPSWSEGTATVSGSGSTWEMSNDLSVGNLDGGRGTLNIQHGGLVSVVGNASVHSTNGTLAFGLGSSGTGLLDVVGEASLAGILDFRLSGSSPFQAGMLTLITYGSRTGTFGPVINLGAYVTGNGLHYQDHALTLTLDHDLLVGDLDLDGDVDFFDYTATSNNFGETEGMRFRHGDMDGDGDVDFFDYIAVSNHFGDSLAAATGPANAASVPEPSTIILLFIGLLVGLLRFRRHRIV